MPPVAQPFALRVRVWLFALIPNPNHNSTCIPSCYPDFAFEFARTATQTFATVSWNDYGAWHKKAFKKPGKHYKPPTVHEWRARKAAAIAVPPAAQVLPVPTLPTLARQALPVSQEAEFLCKRVAVSAIANVLAGVRREVRRAEQRSQWGELLNKQLRQAQQADATNEPEQSLTPAQPRGRPARKLVGAAKLKAANAQARRAGSVAEPPAEQVQVDQVAASGISVGQAVPTGPQKRRQKARPRPAET